MRRLRAHLGTAHDTISDTMCKSTRVALSFPEKHAILLKCKSMGVQKGRKPISEIQSWAQSTFKLRKKPSYRAVMRILKNEAGITEWMNSNGYLRKKAWSNRSNALDEQLAQWVHKMWRRGVFLMGNVI